MVIDSLKHIEIYKDTLNVKIDTLKFYDIANYEFMHAYGIIIVILLIGLVLLKLLK